MTWGLFQKKPSHEEETNWFLPFPGHLSLGFNDGTFYLKSMLLGLVSFSSQAESSWGQQPTQILTPPGPHPKCSNSVTQVLLWGQRWTRLGLVCTECTKGNKTTFDQQAGWWSKKGSGSLVHGILIYRRELKYWNLRPFKIVNSDFLF